MIMNYESNKMKLCMGSTMYGVLEMVFFFLAHEIWTQLFIKCFLEFIGNIKLYILSVPLISLPAGLHGGIFYDKSTK